MLDLNYLYDLSVRHGDSLNQPVARFELRGSRFDPWPEVSMMGVVNLSHDSWYRESVAMTVEAAVRRGRRLAVEGARIIDVGAESTLLNAQRINAQTQTSNLVPVVRELSDLGILVSVETYLPEVALSCLEAGAAIINLTAGNNTEDFYRMIAEWDAGVVICHVQNSENVREVGDFKHAEDQSVVLYEYFARETDRAARCGVKCIWIDPGLGFNYNHLGDSAVRVRYQIETFLNAFRLRSLGWPVCQALPPAFEFFEEEVRCAESFFGVLAMLGQTDLLRTHEVAKLRGVVEAMRVIT